jgi:hypothetical protein
MAVATREYGLFINDESPSVILSTSLKPFNPFGL